jgi:hypothetical protein
VGGSASACLPLATLDGSHIARPPPACRCPLQVAPHALPTPPWLRPFEPGVWLWCTLCLNLANLILAHRHWQSSNGGQSVPAEVWAQLPLGVRVRIVLYRARRVRMTSCLLLLWSHTLCVRGFLLPLLKMALHGEGSGTPSRNAAPPSWRRMIIFIRKPCTALVYLPAISPMLAPACSAC